MEVMASEVEAPKKVAFANRKYSNADRIKKEEEELEQLIAEQKGEAVQQEPQEAEPTNAEEKSFKKRYGDLRSCLLYTSPSPRDRTRSRMPSSA